MNLYSKKINSSVGPLILLADEAALVSLLWETQFEQILTLQHVEEKNHPVFLRTELQLEEYFSGRRIHFDLPLNPRGTEFQKRVWQELVNIPFGQTITYGEQARRLGKPKSARAVGAANGKNPLGIIVPCHRVVGASGSLTGFAGGIEIKRKLLELEANKI